MFGVFGLKDSQSRILLIVFLALSNFLYVPQAHSVSDTIEANVPATFAIADFLNGSPGDYQLNGFSVSGPSDRNLLVGISFEGISTGDYLSLNSDSVTPSYGYSTGADTLSHFTQITFVGKRDDINLNLANGFYFHSSAGVWSDQFKIWLSVTEDVPGLAYYPRDNHYYKVGHFMPGVGETPTVSTTDYAFCPGFDENGDGANPEYVSNYTEIETLTSLDIGSPNCTWSEANRLAKLGSLKGRPGYLANITTQGENDFLQSKLKGALNVWIGGTDGGSDGSSAYSTSSNLADYFANSDLPNGYSNGTEGLWHFYDGPEKGKIFWRLKKNVGDSTIDWRNWASTRERAYWGAGTNSNVTDSNQQVLIFSNWANSEPNNNSSISFNSDHSNNCLGGASAGCLQDGEDNVVFNWNNPDGKWNDLNGYEPTVPFYGYVVEYGDSTPFSDSSRSASTLILPTAGSNPSVLTQEILMVNDTATVLYGTLDAGNKGGSGFFCYGISSNLNDCTRVNASPSLTSPNVVESITASIYGLTPNTKYFYRAIVKFGSLESYGAIKSFDTTNCFELYYLANGQRVAKFNSSSECIWIKPQYVDSVTVVAIAGGGGGGSAQVGGGGGAGEYLVLEDYLIADSVTVRVGAGGAGGAGGTGCPNNVGSNGGNTFISDLILSGGGGGGSNPCGPPSPPLSGGSSGGSAGADLESVTATQTAGGLGNHGGIGVNGHGYPGGGGGGSQSPGQDGSFDALYGYGGNGGMGFARNLIGTTEIFGGGGGGASDNYGGLGGGALISGTPVRCGGHGYGTTAGQAQTSAAGGYGCGGGGGSDHSGGGSGSRGVVFIQYLIPTYAITYVAPNKTSGSVPTQDSTIAGLQITVSSIGDLSRVNHTFRGWSFNDHIYNAGDVLTVTGNINLVAVWTENSTGGSGSSGSGSTTTSPEAKVPGITWTPSVMVEGDAIGDQQLNAVFSVPGNALYSLSRGFKPDPGNLQLTVTFTPEDKATYMVLSTTRTIEVSPKPKPTPSPTPTISPSPSASATPAALPKPTVTPKPTTVKVSELKQIGTIYFNNNEYFLDAKDRSSLVEISALVKSSKFETVIIQGNTDIKQGVDNYWLSKARAEAVSKYLASLTNGPFYNRVWYASKHPIAVGLDKKSLALNRRVEIYAQVTVEKPTVAVTGAPQVPVSRGFDSISFNRNEYFLDATDRKSLVETVQSMAKLGCTQVYLKGSHDKTKSSVNAYIGANRVNAVKKFMAGLLPSLKFSIEPEFVSADRVVQIRCTN